MMNAREIVKSWNAMKKTRYQVSANGGDSSLVKSITSLTERYGVAEQDAERYFNAMLNDESKGDLWDVASLWRVKRWIAENPVEEVVEEVAQVQANPQIDLLGALSKEIVKVIGKDMVENLTSQLREQMDAYIKDKTVVKVVEFDGRRTPLEDVTHKEFETILQFVEMKEPVFLTGPAGSGKNVICEQVAKALGLDFYFSNAVTQEYKLTGYGDAMGNFIETQFYKWAKNGGLFVLDEMDASAPEALIVLNCAIANGYFDFPVIGRVNLHENCHLIACGNTWGTGASMEYVGRNQLDGATLNRFACVEIDYDESIENAVSGGNEQVLAFCRAFRKIANKNGCHVICSYREIGRLHKMIDLAKMDVTKAIKTCVTKGLEKDTIRMIANDMSVEVEYRKNLLELAN